MLPPHPFPLKELSGEVRKPTLEDLKQVFDLRHLARCVEQMYVDKDHDRLRNDYRDPHDSAAAMRERLHTSIYRVLFAGAVLTRPYLEPMFLAPPDLLYRLHRGDGDEAGLWPEDLEYLERFPVYRVEATDEEWEPVFGDLAQWLVDDAKSTAVPVIYPPPRNPPRNPSRSPLGHLNSDDRGCLQEVLFFLAAYEHMIDKFFNECHKEASDAEEMDEELLIPPPFPGDVRDVSTAMFGMFRPEKVSMPAKVEDSPHTCLLNYPLGHYPRDNSVLPKVSPWNTDVRSLLWRIQGLFGRPNRRNGWPAPPPWLRFIEFAMRKFFQVGFRDEVFDEENLWYLRNYTLPFLHSSLLFGRNFFLWEGVSAFLTSYQPPALSWHHYRG